MEMSDKPIRMLSVDPGEEHNGVCAWIGAEVSWVTEMKPYDFLDSLWRWAQPGYLGEYGFDVLVIEDFRLYPNRAVEQGYSQMGTPKVIGAAEWIMRSLRREQDVILQGASIKKATYAQLQARGVKLRGQNDHMRDAEVHGYYFIRSGGLEKWQQSKKSSMTS